MINKLYIINKIIKKKKLSKIIQNNKKDELKNSIKKYNKNLINNTQI
jgi:hypothetical protein